MKHPELRTDRDGNKSAPDSNVTVKVENSDKPKKFTAMATVNDIAEFRRKLADAEACSSLGTSPPKPTSSISADLVSQNESQDSDAAGDSEGGGVEDVELVIPESAVRAESVVHSLPPVSIESVHVQVSQSNFVAGTENTNRDDWIADSGSNTHLANNLKWFSSVHAIQMDLGTVSSQASLDIVGGGCVSLHLKNSNGDVSELELSDVAFAPNSRLNILSLSCLFEKGTFRGKWGRTITIETADGYEIGVAELRKEEGLYYFVLAG